MLVDRLLNKLPVVADPSLIFPFFAVTDCRLFDSPDWLLKTTGSRDKGLLAPVTSFLFTAWLPPKKDVLCFRFLLAPNAIDRLPVVF